MNLDEMFGQAHDLVLRKSRFNLAMANFKSSLEELQRAGEILGHEVKGQLIVNFNQHQNE